LKSTSQENGIWNTTNAQKPTTREKEKPKKKNAMLSRAASMTLTMTIVTLNGKNGKPISISKIGDQTSI
jgi:hypothetical protein